MTRVRVLITVAVILVLPSLVMAQASAKVVFGDQLRAAQPLAGDGQLVVGGQLSVVEGACAPRPQALVQKRAADGSVLWERAARSSPERGALPLFAGLGQIDPQAVILSTIHAVASDPLSGDVIVAGDVFSRAVGIDDKTATVRGGFVVRLTSHGEPIAERYIGALPPAGASFTASLLEPVCATEVCAVQAVGVGTVTTSLRELVITPSGDVMVRGFRREAGNRKPILAVLTGDLDRMLSSKTGEEVSTSWPPAEVKMVQAKPIHRTLDPHQQAPEGFTIESGMLDSGGLPELSASDNQYLSFFAAVQNEEKSLGEVVAEFTLKPEMPVLEKVTAEVRVEQCATITLSLGGGLLGDDMIDLAQQDLCPFDEPTITVPVPGEVADQLGFGRSVNDAAGELPAFVSVRFDIQRDPSSGCPPGAQCSTQGESGDVDLIILTTDYP